MTDNANANELTIARTYDAPLPNVWEAWTDPKQVAQWWGPRGFTITTKSKDVRTGGSWMYTMHGPDGVDYPNHTKFLEVEKPVRMVYDHGGSEDRPPMFRVTVRFEQHSGGVSKTTMYITMTFASAELAIESKRFIKQAGGDATWDRLAEYLVKQQHGKEVFVINRSFAAPIEQMYAMWSDARHLAKWLAPNGSMEFMRSDIKVGGSTFSVMKHGADSPPMFARAEYLELTRPIHRANERTIGGGLSRIVHTQQFCDNNEKVVRHPMAATWPETMLSTVTLTPEGDDHTRVTIEWEPFGEVTSEELETFVSARAGMTMGWTGSLDGLEAHVATQR
jgi:uncharacterized protein YndB with AHSA1/START domain